MNATTLRAAVIGCGKISHNHATAYRAIPGVDLVACCDADPARAGRLADEFGAVAVSPDGLHLLELDIVSVCTPHPTHEAIVVDSAAHGVHVLCEKPLAVDLASAIRMVSACHEAGVTLGGVFQRRFWPAAQRIRAAIDEHFGIPVFGRVSVMLHRDTSYYSADPWRGLWDTDGGGVLMTQAIHYIDLLTWFMGDVVEVSASNATLMHGAAIEVEDSSVAILRFASGGLATLEASTALAPSLGCSVRVTGASGDTIGLVEYPEGSVARLDTALSPIPTGSGDPTLEQINAALRPFHAMQIADFVDAVRMGRQPLVTGRDATESLAVLTALYESANTGCPATVASVPTALDKESPACP